MNFFKYSFIIIFACSLVSSSVPADQKKRAKTAAPQVVQTAYSNSQLTQQLAAGAGRSFMNFLARNGIAPQSARSANISSSVQASGLLKAQLQNITLPKAMPSVIRWNSSSGTPRLIEYHYPTQGNSVSSVPSRKNPVAIARQFMLDNKILLKIDDPESEFRLIGSHTDEQGLSHVRFQQQYKGIEVWAKDAYVHIDQAGRVVSFNGVYIPTPSLDATPQITSSTAVNVVLEDLHAKGFTEGVPNVFKKILPYAGASFTKVIWCNEIPAPHLAWFVEARSGIDHDWFYFIDASTGKILRSYDNIDHDGSVASSGVDLNGVTRSFSTYLIGGTYYMMDASQPMFDAADSKLPDNPVGALTALDLRNTDVSAQSQFYYVTSSNNQWADKSTVSALYNAGITYNFYRNAFHRNSINDSGMTIYSVVHVTSNNQPMDNAFWNGYFMAYGDGSQSFKPLAGGLDVAAHEMTHGVTQHSANLEYVDQSGALNESMSDAFAAIVDSLNWTIGETVVKDFTDFPTGALRDLANPHNGGTAGSAAWQPATVGEYVNTTQDNGGVHVNSGIPNHAFYLVASTIGRNEASKIWYKALTAYMTKSSQFVDARIATVNAATELFEQSSNEVKVVKNAWSTVGVTDSVGTPPPPATQLVGTNYLLVANTAPSDPNSLYITRTVINSYSDYAALTQTPVLTKPAVSDNGEIVLFVDTDNRLRALYTNPANPQEQFIDTNAVWWSVAIGPGLSSIAFTSKNIDTTIYYLDLVNNVSKAFKIVTQTYDAPDTKTALYADALSFDPTGRYLLFDAYNQIKGAQGDTIHFWNIGLLDVTTERMSTALPPQPQGLELANPSFSKTTQNRFAFDYWDESSGEDYVLAANFSTSNIGVVTGPQDVLGYPSYSADDDTIVFHTTTYYQFDQHDAVEKMPLLADQITGSGIPQSHSIDATYPVWFVIGSRVSEVKHVPEIPTSDGLMQNYPNPFNPSTTIRYQLNAAGHVTLKVYDVLGREVAMLVDERQSAGTHTVTFDASELASGVYFYRVSANGFTETKKMILTK